METIKVNMSPNPLDVQTIHASQNDNEAREWGFELHNNGDVIDASEITDQMVFKAYKGGTEQLLPENTSTPTTSPFKGDIRYPQGLLTDQEFTYRQSPTEEDGLAKITDIKGNTLVWNQHSDTITPGTASKGLTMTRKTGVDIPTLHIEGTYNYVPGEDVNFYFGWATARPKFAIGHKILVSTTMKNFGVGVYGATSTIIYTGEKSILATITQANYLNLLFRCKLPNGSAINEDFTVNVFDLTQMGLDSITSVEEFTSLFSLPYYAYNQGSLLSFNGNGIKTVGKNLLNARTTYTNNGITFTNDNGIISISGTATANAFFTTTIGLRNASYFIGAFNDEINANVHVAVQNKSGAYLLDGVTSSKNRIFSINNDINNFIIWVNVGKTVNNFVLKPMISFESPEYFEPYTSSTLSLPISTYFPTGMKSAGNVYDELTPRKAITRIGAVNLGSLTWALNDATNHVFEATITDMNPMANYQNNFNFASSMYTPSVLGKADMPNLSVRQASNNSNHIFLKNTSYSDASSFTSAMNNVYLYYELATPTETSFTTASLVTENAEIPLSNNDDVLICKCTEELSAEPGFHDAKIKLSDGDGTCYSNKLQLHVERKP